MDISPLLCISNNLEKPFCQIFYKMAPTPSKKSLHQKSLSWSRFLRRHSPTKHAPRLRGLWLRLRPGEAVDQMSWALSAGLSERSPARFRYGPQSLLQLGPRHEKNAHAILPPRTFGVGLMWLTKVQIESMVISRLWSRCEVHQV